MAKILNILIESGAILEGHFLLTSGRHSNKYIEKFRLIEKPQSLDFVCSSMADLYKNKNINVVLGAAVGGILISGGVGQKLNVKHIFTERVNGVMELRRGFSVDKNTIPSNAQITHTSLNDNTVEGIELKDSPAFSIQYHPESSPGPHDSRYIFKQFFQMMDKNAKKK